MTISLNIHLKGSVLNSLDITSQTGSFTMQCENSYLRYFLSESSYFSYHQWFLQYTLIWKC